MSDQQIHNYGPQYAGEAITEKIVFGSPEPASGYSLQQLLPPPVHVAPKPRLHWLQAVFYVIGIITCLVVLFAIVDAYYVIHQLQEALKSVGDSFNELTP